MIAVEARLTDRRGQSLNDVSARSFRLAVDGLTCPRLTTEPMAMPAAGTSPLSITAKRERASPTLISQADDSRVRVVLLVDFVNSAVVDRMRLQIALRRLLGGPMIAGEEIELLELLPPLTILHKFTDDFVAMRAALALISPLAGGPGPPAAFQYPPILLSPGSMGAAARRQLAFFDHIRSAATLAGFRALAQTLARAPGRKIVVWITADASALNPSFAFQFSLDNPAEQPIATPAAELHATFHALNAADVAIWPLQIRGVSNPEAVNASSAAGDPETLQLLQANRAGDARLAMFTVAESTGGRVLEGGNDLVGLLRRALALAQGYYLLTCPFTLVGRVPHGHALRGGELLLAPGYHKIRVKVARRAVHVLARRGVLIDAR